MLDFEDCIFDRSYLSSFAILNLFSVKILFPKIIYWKMDLSQYLPAELTQSNGRHHLEEERKLKDKINTHAKEIQNLGNQLFGKMLYRRKLENSIRNQKAM